LNATLTFCLSVIVDFERSLTSEEVWISLWMEVIWNLFSIKSTSDYTCNLWLIILVVWTCLSESASFGKVISLSSLTLSSDIPITFWQIWNRVSWNIFSLKYIVTIILRSSLSVKSFHLRISLISEMSYTSVRSLT